MRLFIAINFSKSLRRRMVKATRPLRAEELPVRWTEPARLHLTMKFLGDVRERRVDDVVETLERVCSGFKPFEVGFERVGAFPSLRSPRVIWMGVEATMEMRAVKHDLEHGFVELGFSRETRAFQPHVTLARTNDEAEVGDFRDLEPLAREVEMDATYRVANLDLMHSRLRPDGPEYTRLHTARLGASS